MNSDQEYLKKAIALTSKSVDEGGFPCGCVIVQNEVVIGEGMSMSETHHDPTGHAEVMAIRSAASQYHSAELSGATLYSSLEPCLMCFHSSYWAGISRIVFGARKDKVSPGYYEGNASLSSAAEVLNRNLDLEFLPDFEEQMIELIQEWERRITKGPN